MAKEDTRRLCGLLCFRPICLQPLGNIQSFVGVFALLGLLTWSLYTVFVSQITQIEKAFGLSSSQTGWLFTIWEIGYVCCTLFVAYFSPRAHIPKVLGFVTILCSLSAFISALPHFVAFKEPSYTIGVNDTEVNTDTSEIQKSLCLLKEIEETMTDNPVETDDTEIGNSRRTLAYALFNIAMILQGVGKAPCYPYSAQYIDDNGKKEHTGFFVSIVSSVSIFGLAIGYGIGSAISQMYVTLEDTPLKPTDSRFISAWWFGFIFIGLAVFLIALVMFCYPKTFKTAKIKANDTRQEKGINALLKEIKGMMTDIFMIIKNPLYIFALLGSCMQCLSQASFFSFEPKYLETQFAVSPWLASIVIGVSSIASFAIGSIISGLVTKKFNMGPFATLRFILVFYIFVIIIQAVVIGIGCPTQEIVNPLEETDFRSPSTPPASIQPCVCTPDQFLPICGDDGRVYYSPCHAGCTSGTVQEFSNCTFIPGGVAKAGMCPTDCKLMWVFAALKFLMNLFEAVASIPVFLIFLRSAGEERKALALGISAVAISVLAWIPGPVIGGRLIDNTCQLWVSGATSGEYCAHYDLVQLRNRLFGFLLGVRCFAFALLGVAMWKARKIPAWPTSEKTECDGDMHGVEMGEKSTLGD